MTKGICLYLLVLCFYLSFQKRLGGFKRVKYDKGDLMMEKALKSAESIYSSYTTADTIMSVITVYEKIVNGISFNFVLSFRRRNSDDILIGDYVVYISDLENWDKEELSVTKAMILDKGNYMGIHDIKYQYINNEIANKASLIKRKLNYIVNIEKYENVPENNDIDVFVVEAQFEGWKDTEKVVVYQEKEYTNFFELLIENK